jgi:hypothetical protein
MCEVVDQISEWRDVAAEVVELLNTHQAAIPSGRERRIREALELPEATLSGVQQACRVLQLEVEGLVASLPAVPGIATVLGAGLIAVAAGVLVVTVVSNLVAAEIQIHNEGCGDLPVAEVLGIPGRALLDTPLPDVLGIALPEVIEDGGSAAVSLPPVSILVDNVTEPGVFQLGVLGLERRLLAGQVTDVLFDGASLLGARRLISLGQDGLHELTIRCVR